MELLFLETVDSTNKYAKENLSKINDKTLIYANYQSAGRGRLQRKWNSNSGENVYASIVLKPSKKLKDVYANLTQYLSLILAETIEDYGIYSQIKWPNDVLINGKKIAGLLSETVVQGDSFKGLILGIGVNLNAKLEDVNAIPDKVATSLNLELNKNIDMYEFIQRLSDKFFVNYDEFLVKGFEFIKSDYISRVSFLDTEISVQVLNEVKSGLAKSISDSGELVLENNGKEFVLTIGDILC